MGTWLGSRKVEREPVTYTLEVLARKDGCRSGLEVGDKWDFQWNTPAGLCPKSILVMFPLTTAIESGGDMRERGGESRNSIRFTCPDGVIEYRLTANRVVPTLAEQGK